jgi:hypothetical protein
MNTQEQSAMLKLSMGAWSSQHITKHGSTLVPLFNRLSSALGSSSPIDEKGAMMQKA